MIGYLLNNEVLLLCNLLILVIISKLVLISWYNNDKKKKPRTHIIKIFSCTSKAGHWTEYELYEPEYWIWLSYTRFFFDVKPYELRYCISSADIRGCLFGVSYKIKDPRQTHNKPKDPAVELTR